MVRISVKNFGPIVEGSVDLKPLTIFIGPSNTGKSFMAGAVYSVMKALRVDNLVPPRRMFVGGAMYTDKVIGNLWEVPCEDSSFGDAVWAWARELQREGLDPQQLTIAGFPEAVRATLEDITVQEISQVRSDVISHLRQEHRRPSALVTRGAQLTDFRLTIHRDEPLLHIDIQLVDEESAEIDFDISNIEVDPSPLALLEYKPGLNEEPIDIFFEVVSSWMNSLAAKVLDGVPEQSYYLPAARSGTVQGYRILAADIIHRAARSGGSPDNIPDLPSVTTEFLGNLIRLDRRMRRRTTDTSMDNAISFIESQILHGKIDLNESPALPISEIVYLPSEAQSESGEFTLDETSSMVSELAPLVLFLKYLVRPGDLLILEEPESHLHPAAQRQMARGIVRLVNAGVNVLITTHSDLFVAQVNNLMRISHASKRWLREKGFAPEECIDRENVGAYLFRRNEEQGGSVVEELEIRPDVGIDDAMFGGVINEIYEETLLVERIRVP